MLHMAPCLTSDHHHNHQGFPCGPICASVCTWHLSEFSHAFAYQYITIFWKEGTWLPIPLSVWCRKLWFSGRHQLHGCCNDISEICSCNDGRCESHLTHRSLLAKIPALLSASRCFRPLSLKSGTALTFAKCQKNRNKIGDEADLKYRVAHLTAPP